MRNHEWLRKQTVIGGITCETAACLDEINMT